jgi:MFS family permease
VTLGRYGRILRAPGAAHVFAGLILSRIALGGSGLMVLLFVRAQAGSFGAAGIVLAGYTLAACFMWPLLGRLADRRGQTIAVLSPLAIYLLGVGALIVAGLHHAPTGVLVVCAAVGGGALPPVSVLVRPLLPTLTGPDPQALNAAYALDAILIELGFITGPLVGSALIAVASPAAALIVMMGFVAAGAIVFSSSPVSRGWRAERGEGARVGPLRAPGLRTLLVAALTVGVSFGSLEVAMPAFATAHGARAASGVLLAVVSLASAAGGLAFGTRGHGVRALHLDYLALLLIVPAAFALMLLASSIAVMAPLALLAGASIAPLVAAQNQLVTQVSPRLAITESYTWMSGALTGGVALGAAAAGALVDASGWRAAIVCACAVTASGGAITLARRNTLVLA